MRASPVAIEEPAGMQVPPVIPHVLIGIIEGGVPAARAEFVQVLFIGHRTHDPFHGKIARGVEYLRTRNVHAAHPDIEGVLAEVAFHRLDLLGLAVKLDTHGAPPRLFLRIANRFFADLFDLVLDHAYITALRLEPAPFRLTSIILAGREYYLHTHLLFRTNIRHRFDDLGERVHLVFFFRVFLELEFDIRLYRIRITSRFVPVVLGIDSVDVRIKFELRCVIFDLDKFHLGVLRIKGCFGDPAMRRPRPYVEMHLAAKGSHFEGEYRPYLPLPFAVEVRRLALVYPEVREHRLHRARGFDELAGHFDLQKYPLFIRDEIRLHVPHPCFPAPPHRRRQDPNGRGAHDPREYKERKVRYLMPKDAEQARK